MYNYNDNEEFKNKVKSFLIGFNHGLINHVKQNHCIICNNIINGKINVWVDYPNYKIDHNDVILEFFYIDIYKIKLYQLRISNEFILNVKNIELFNKMIKDLDEILNNVKLISEDNYNELNYNKNNTF